MQATVLKKEVLEERRMACSPEAIRLFKALGKINPSVRDLIIKRYLGKSVSSYNEREAYDYFISTSPIVSATAANKGSSVTTEFLYDGPTLKPFSSIDRYFLQSKAGKAVKSRLAVIERELAKLIKHLCCERNGSREEILIANLGSGPGRDSINVLADNHFSNVRAINFDIDEKALERGKWIAETRGVSDRVSFKKANLMKYQPEKKADIVLLIGVLCPLPHQTCVTVLKAVKKFLKPGGCLIASNVSSRMINEDPFTCFLMKWTAGWELIYKTEYELKEIFQESGYDWNGSFRDHYKFHIMGMGSLSDRN